VEAVEAEVVEAEVVEAEAEAEAEAEVEAEVEAVVVAALPAADAADAAAVAVPPQRARPALHQIRQAPEQPAVRLIRSKILHHRLRRRTFRPSWRRRLKW